MGIASHRSQEDFVCISTKGPEVIQVYGLKPDICHSKYICIYKCLGNKLRNKQQEKENGDYIAQITCL